ncbi:MAG: type II toxin-antitoxin system RelE/ParE family toxin [Hyphomicrobiales bacterium]|nr:type II toxin-antitoxin system RelE/ParE family toxin [Hyphomicrobiales bacterium]
MGADFLRAVEVVAASIQRNPHQYQQVHGRAQRARLRRFPYGLIYYIKDGDVVVLACMHGARDPKRWQDRG